ncbi:MAG TPA: hypothetical protein PKO06_16160 [Candidatus Ozemobacteraceae bacterium]|nr:hypothetical protein [Candidatus Ozemobacteraceae bacterium]
MKPTIRVLFVACALLIGCLSLATVSAFNRRDLVLVNILWPVVKAGLAAHQNERPLLPAMLQAAAGGAMMKHGLELASECHSNQPGEVWKAKLLFNAGASLAECAGERNLQFRMDLGPVWMIADQSCIRFRPAVHAMIAPLLNMSDGAKFDLGKSLQFGTTTFRRTPRRDGTITSGGALAYSNANNIITNPSGSHLGHELVHTFQYRRDAFLSVPITHFSPRLQKLLPDNIIDDTGWGINWAIQRCWADWTGKDPDFEIYMEKEAYYLADGVHF